MTEIVIKLESDLYKKIKIRANKNFLSINDLITDIVRRSMISYRKKGEPISGETSDGLVNIFSRNRRGRK